MRIDGKKIADAILESLVPEVLTLKKKGCIPALAVIQVGDDPASTAYISQKKKAAERIGAVLKHEKLPADVSYQHVNILIHEYNANPAIHGIIVQRPLPDTLSDAKAALVSITPQKDVDGFVPNSPFTVPVAAAVLTILEDVYGLTRSDLVNKQNRTPSQDEDFSDWLRRQSIVVIGRGETAGKPIAEALGKRGCTPSIVHSQTPNPKQIIKDADIVISCVGRERMVTKDSIKPNAILIGVGLWRDNKGNLRGDYEEDEIKDIAAFYTPTPGGVGPVNVACLMQNLVKGCILGRALLRVKLRTGKGGHYG